MRYGIDASNLRSGGGLNHLLCLLEHRRYSQGDDTNIILWGSSALCDLIPPRKWITVKVVPDLDAGPLKRLSWQMLRFPKLSSSACDVLFAPGGLIGDHHVPTVVMCRNMLPFELSEARRYGASYMLARLLFLRLLQAQAFRRADGVVFLSDYARDRVVEQIGALSGMTALIAHGVEHRFRREPRVQRSIKEFSSAREFRLLYVSIVDVYKHQWNVATAVADLRLKGMPITLEIVGPAYPPALRRLNLSLQKVDPTGSFIQYCGEVSHSELHHRLLNADGFVFASTCENMPNILLEAMAAGLPIACSDRRPMVDILGEASVFFDPLRPDSISRAIAGMLQDTDERTHIARRAYEQANLYSWEQCASDTFSFIKECAGKRATDQAADIWD